MATRIDLTMSQVRAVSMMLADELGDDIDEKLRLDMFEGSTDLFEIVGQLLNSIETDEGVTASLVAQIGERNFRKERAGHRIEQRRLAIAALLECAGLDKLSLPEATISLRRLPPKLVVADESALPEPLWRVKRTPDMALVKSAWDADGAVPGVVQGNGGEPSLTIRRK